MQNIDLLTTSEVADRLGITRQAVLARVHAKTLVPAYQAPRNGVLLFDPKVVEAARRRYER